MGLGLETHSWARALMTEHFSTLQANRAQSWLSTLLAIQLYLAARLKQTKSSQTTHSKDRRTLDNPPQPRHSLLAVNRFAIKLRMNLHLEKKKKKKS